MENEDVLFNRIHAQNSNLSSGYSTISSGTDQEELIEIQNANIQLILEQQEQAKVDQAAELKELQIKLQKQSQLKAAEKLSAKLSAKSTNLGSKKININQGANHDEKHTKDDHLQTIVSRANAPNASTKN